MRKPDLKRLKVHLSGGCETGWNWNYEGKKSIATPRPPRAAYLEEEYREEYDRTYYTAHAAITDRLEEVTCGYCKTKIMNELWFKDWKDLDQRELDLLHILWKRRYDRKMKEYQAIK